MIHGKCDKCETCVNQADLISSAEEAICPDCIKGSHYVESYISGLKRQIAELNKEVFLLHDELGQEKDYESQLSEKDSQIKELKKDLDTGINIVNKQIKEIAELKKQIESLECCGNCDNRTFGTFDCGFQNILREDYKQKATP